MIRILFTIVALVAAILGVVLPMPELFFAAGLALLITIGLVVVRARRRAAASRPPKGKYAPTPYQGAEDLSALGILEIRPRQKGNEGRPEDDDAQRFYDDVQDEEAAVTPSEPAWRRRQMTAPRGEATYSYGTGPREDRAVSAPGDGALDDVDAFSEDREELHRTAPETTPTYAAARELEANGAGAPADSIVSINEKSTHLRAGVDERVPDHYREVIAPFLQSFRAAIQAHTVCLLKQPVDSLHHHIEAIVSLNGYARSGGDFATRVPLLQTRDSHMATEVRRVSDDDFPATSVGYYREAINVKEIAVTPVPGEAAAGQYLLLADSMKEHAFDDERTLSLTQHFARLLGAVMDGTSGGAVLDSYDYVRPRREIINEEIQRARMAKRPLVLALVHLNRAESVADEGARAVQDAERELAAHLRRTARNARVERFGELTFGVFFNAAASTVEKWASRLQLELESSVGLLEGGVSIGIAVLQDRHEDADSFRRDATEALREAYETGTAIIVE